MPPTAGIFRYAILSVFVQFARHSARKIPAIRQKLDPMPIIFMVHKEVLFLGLDRIVSLPELLPELVVVHMKGDGIGHARIAAQGIFRERLEDSVQRCPELGLVVCHDQLPCKIVKRRYLHR